MKEQSARSFRRQIKCTPDCERLEDRLVLSGNTPLSSPTVALAFASQSQEQPVIVQAPSPAGNLATQRAALPSGINSAGNQQLGNNAVDNDTSRQTSQLKGNADSGFNSVSTSNQDNTHSNSTGSASGQSKTGNQSNSSSHSKTESGKPVAHKPGESSKPKTSAKPVPADLGPTRQEAEPVVRDESQLIGILAENDPDTDSTPDGALVVMDAMVASNLKVGWLRPDILELPAIGGKDMPGRSSSDQQPGWISSRHGDTSYEGEVADELDQGPGTTVVAVPVAKVLLPDLDDSIGLAAFMPESSFSLELALGQFLENVEQFGEDLVAAMKSSPLASWLAVLAASALAAEMTRRRWQYEREQRALAAAHADGTLGWTAGLPGPFSSEEV
jgi:hypothetical protein